MFVHIKIIIRADVSVKLAGLLIPNFDADNESVINESQISNKHATVQVI